MDSGDGDRSHRLARLNEEERSVSTRRARLQDRIDFLRSGGRASTEDVTALIADLVQQEQELSQQRLELHERIELARAELRRSRS